MISFYAFSRSDMRERCLYCTIRVVPSAHGRSGEHPPRRRSGDARHVGIEHRVARRREIPTLARRRAHPRHPCVSLVDSCVRSAS